MFIMLHQIYAFYFHTFRHTAIVVNKMGATMARIEGVTEVLLIIGLPRGHHSAW